MVGGGRRENEEKKERSGSKECSLSADDLPVLLFARI